MDTYKVHRGSAYRRKPEYPGIWLDMCVYGFTLAVILANVLAK